MPATDALASDGDGPAGPTAFPGTYRVTLTVGGQTRTAELVVRGNPNVTATAADYAAQFALLAALTDALSRLHGAVNRIRQLKRGLERAPAERGDKARDALEAIEGVLVDIRRRSPRDVLRHPAGLNDTLADLIAGVGIADMAPTESHAAVSREIIAKVDAEIALLRGCGGWRRAAGDAPATGGVSGLRRERWIFLERLFGFSPDGGNGSFELLLFLIPIAGIAAVAGYRVRRTRRRARHP